MIAGELKLRLGIEPEAGAAFFAGEGAATGERWGRFLGWLEGQAVACAADDEIVDAARATFRTFGDWLDRRGALR